MFNYLKYILIFVWAMIIIVLSCFYKGDKKVLIEIILTLAILVLPIIYIDVKKEDEEEK